MLFKITDSIMLLRDTTRYKIPASKIVNVKDV